MDLYMYTYIYVMVVVNVRFLWRHHVVGDGEILSVFFASFRRFAYDFTCTRMKNEYVAIE